MKKFFLLALFAASVSASAAGPTSGIVDKLFVQTGAGAVARPVVEKLKESSSIEDFGAKCDGVTDTRVAIQKAIDAMNARGGGVVTIPAKTCMVSFTNYYKNDGTTVFGGMSILMRNNVYLKGQGAASVIKVMPNAYGAGAYYRAIASRGESDRLVNSGLSDLTIDGNRDNQVTSKQASNIELETSKNIRIVRVNSMNSNGNGIMVRGTTTSYAENVEISSSTVRNASNIGIQSSHFDGLRIINNDVAGTGDNGIDIYGEDGTTTAHGKAFTISYNRVAYAGIVGIFLETVRDGVVSDNVVEHSMIGITVNRINGEPKNIKITANATVECEIGFRGTGDTGGVAIINNSFTYFNVSGAQLSGGKAGGGNSSYYDISGNTFVPNTTTTPIIYLMGDVASFNTGRNNIVIKAGMNIGYLYLKASVTSVDNSIGGFRVLPSQVGPDLYAEKPSFKTLELLNAAVENTAGPVTAAIADYSCGSLLVTATQGGIGSSYWSIPYCKRAGVLTLGTPAKTVAGSDPISTVTVVTGDARIALVSGNTYVRWAVQTIPLQ